MIHPGELGSMEQGGETNTNALLTLDDVLEIKLAYRESGGRRGMKAELGREYGVTQMCIGLILAGKRWKHAKLEDYERLKNAFGKYFWERRMG